VNLFINHFPIL